MECLVGGLVEVLLPLCGEGILTLIVDLVAFVVKKLSDAAKKDAESDSFSIWTLVFWFVLPFAVISTAVFFFGLFFQGNPPAR